MAGVEGVEVNVVGVVVGVVDDSREEYKVFFTHVSRVLDPAFSQKNGSRALYLEQMIIDNLNQYTN